MRHACVDKITLTASTCNDTFASRYLGATAPKYVTLATEKVTLVTSSEPEWHKTSLLEQEVLPGDIIGYVSNSGVGEISTRTPESDEQPDEEVTSQSWNSVAVDDEYASGGRTDSGTRHLVRALASRPGMAKFFHMYAVDGEYTIVIEMTNDHLSSTPIQANCTIIVAQAINTTVIIAPAYAATNSPVDFGLEPHSGM